MSKVDRWMYNQYKVVICISEKTENNLRDFIGNTKSNMITIHNGINVSKYVNAAKLDKEVVGTDKTIITMVAAFRAEKDQETLVRAVKRLDESKYILWLVGDGEKHDALVQYIYDQGMTDRVRIWGNRNDVPSILKSSDIVVMSSHWEGFGLAAAEGMAAGNPVIATNVDGLAQVIGNAGILFTPEDDKQLADIIKRLSEDKILYDEVSAKCSKQAELFDISMMVSGYLSVYNSLKR
jgi:glycosyltransferase involved in cell wall biosynthesis